MRARHAVRIIRCNKLFALAITLSRDNDKQAQQRHAREQNFRRKSMKTVSARALALLTVAFFVGCAPDSALRAPAGLERIEHVVVIYAENRSFDHLYGLFPGAEGIAD